MSDGQRDCDGRDELSCGELYTVIALVCVMGSMTVIQGKMNLDVVSYIQLLPLCV